MSVVSDAKKLLRQAKKWTRDEAYIDRTLSLLQHHKRGMNYSRTDSQREHHTKRYHRHYRILAKLVSDKTRIEYTLHKIQREINREIAKRRKLA